jgi:hypothetical protein
VTVALNGITVSAPPGAIAAGKTLRIARATANDIGPEPASSIIGGAYLISTSQGQPKAPVTVSFPYSPGELRPGGTPLVLHRDSLLDAWAPETGSVDTTAHTVSVTTASFSPFDVADSIVYWSGVIAGNRADPPSHCAAGSPSPDWVQDVSLPNSKTLPLPLCFESWTDTQATLDVVNNRGYPQVVSVYGADVDINPSRLGSSIAGTITNALAAIAPTGHNSVLIAPTSEAHIVLKRPPEQPASIFVTISREEPHLGTRAELLYLAMQAAAKQIPLPETIKISDCVLQVWAAQTSDAAFLEGLQNCSEIIASSDRYSKLLKKITAAEGVLNFFYNLQDLAADDVYPPDIGFTIKGTGILNNDITVGPYDLGTIAPGATYHLQLHATGGTPPYEFHIFNGTANDNNPPPWASLSESGLLTLSPPAGDNGKYRFYVFAFDSQRQHEAFARDTIKVATGEGEAPFFNQPNVLTPTVPEALWSAPMASQGRIFPKVDGSVITTKCSWHNPDDGDAPFAVQQIAAGGSLSWRRPDYQGAGCLGLVTDSANNAYYFTTDDLGAHIRSVSPAGQIRWTSAVLASSIDRVYYSGPTLGADGNVYFPLYNGWGNGFIVGLDEQTGSVSMMQSAGFVTSLFAYDDGLIDIDGYGTVRYLGYDGAESASYTVPDIEFDALGQVAPDGMGGVFLAGGSTTDCNHGASNDAFSVAKVTPTGKAWEWTDPGSNGCERGSATATPNGGVVVTESPGGASNASVIALDSAGHVLWRTPVQPDNGLTFAGPLMADTAGVVAVPTYASYDCDAGPDQCIKLSVAFVGQNTGATVLPRVTATNESYTHSTGGNPWGALAIAPDRVFAGASPYLDNDSYPTHSDALVALSAPGVADDYMRARALEVAAGG